MFMLPRRVLILAGDSAKLDTPVGANAPTSVTTDNATLNIVVSLACEKWAGERLRNPAKSKGGAIGDYVNVTVRTRGYEIISPFPLTPE